MMLAGERRKTEVIAVWDCSKNAERESSGDGMGGGGGVRWAVLAH